MPTPVRHMILLTFVPVLGLLFMATAMGAELLVKSGDQVAFLGDSITAQGWTNAHGYVKLVVAGLEADGVGIIPLPAGVGGHKSNDMLARLKRDVLDRKPDWVTVSCGMNDVIHGAKGVPLDQYQINMADLVGQCRAAGIKVALFTTTTAGKPDSDASLKLGRYSAYLRELAKEKDCLLVDLFPVFVEVGRTADPLHGLTGDGVHMTPEGNILIARTVLTTLGCTGAQIAKAHETWLDLPGAGNFMTRVDIEQNKKFFAVSTTATLRQREMLLAAAAAAKRPTLMHWSRDLLMSLMKRKVKPAGPHESLEALFNPGVKDRIQAELQVEFEAEIGRVVKDGQASRIAGGK